MSNNIIALNETNFDQTLAESNQIVLVDFWADWCAPCKMIAPILDEVAAEYSEKLIFTKLDIVESPSIAPKFGIRGIPTLLLFKDGKVIGTHVGGLSKLQLKTFIDNHL